MLMRLPRRRVSFRCPPASYTGGLVRIGSLTRHAALVVAGAALGTLGLAVPAVAAAAPAHSAPARPAPRPVSDVGQVRAAPRAALPSGEQYVCPAPSRPG